MLSFTYKSNTGYVLAQNLWIYTYFESICNFGGVGFGYAHITINGTGKTNFKSIHICLGIVYQCFYMLWNI